MRKEIVDSVKKMKRKGKMKEREKKDERKGKAYQWRPGHRARPF